MVINRKLQIFFFGEVRGTGKSDAEEFHEAMNTLNMGKGDIKSILRVISINLYFGNKKFKKHVSNQKMDSMLYDKFSLALESIASNPFFDRIHVF